MSESRTALIAGSSGLVGSHLVTLLLETDDFDRVISIGRRRLPRDHPKLEQRVLDFTDPAPLLDLPPIAAGFSCLGTTIKVAGSQPAFYAVDHDAVLLTARAAHGSGASTFVHVTALGASPRSRIFYNRVKGETERDVAALGLGSVTAMRPSLIDGDRPESRPGEQTAARVMRTLAPVLGPFRPNHARDIAAAMIVVGREARPGVHVVPAGRIHALADDLGATAPR